LSFATFTALFVPTPSFSLSLPPAMPICYSASPYISTLTALFYSVPL
jgi:hypothetical protein